MGPVKSSGDENEASQKQFLTDKQKKAIKKVMNESRNDLKKMIIRDLDRTFTQTAIKCVVAVEGAEPPSKRKRKKRTTSA
jgi:TFIIF-interacting CTD phosphatase-like protein